MNAQVQQDISELAEAVVSDDGNEANEPNIAKKTLLGTFVALQAVVTAINDRPDLSEKAIAYILASTIEGAGNAITDTLQLIGTDEESDKAEVVRAKRALLSIIDELFG